MDEMIRMKNWLKKILGGGESTATPPTPADGFIARDPLAVENARARHWLGVFERHWENKRGWL